MATLIEQIENIDITEKQISVEERIVSGTQVDQKTQNALKSTRETLEQNYAAVVSVEGTSEQNNQQ